jgi:hypothetical protein
MAKTGIYIKPLAGVGTSNIANKSGDPQNITSYKAEIGAGISFKNLSVEAGIGYMKTGYMFEGIFFEENFLNPGSTSTINVRSNHFYIPVRAAYTINITRKFSVIPSIGTGLAISTDRSSTIESVDGGQTIRTWETSTKTDLYNLLGEASLYAGFSIGKLTIMAGPGYKRMLTNLNGYTPPIEYLITVDAGISYRL